MNSPLTVLLVFSVILNVVLLAGIVRAFRHISRAVNRAAKFEDIAARKTSDLIAARAVMNWTASRQRKAVIEECLGMIDSPDARSFLKRIMVLVGFSKDSQAQYLYLKKQRSL